MADRFKAWMVHLFTASGMLTVFMALLATANGNFRNAMLWLLAAQLIDGIDGTLARRFRVEEILPHVSGKSIDFVIDFAGYSIIPAYIIYRADLMPEPLALAAALLILLTSAVYYGKSGMISDDYYFIGFPVMWNLVAFYLLFIFSFPAAVNAVLIAILAAMQFLPIKFAYPSRTRRWRPANLIITVIAMVSVTFFLLLYPDPPVIFYWGCLLALAYFTVFAFFATFIFENGEADGS
ncbi:MAG: phosphatidylcholine/phosphatidylserine synthase [Bacteroidetes bacterium]|jgi:phosphatidylcholine synthase|nr:phosphatidylcholine/phosphatidylserine synthase [Bacteroidota bacterium]